MTYWSSCWLEQVKIILDDFLELCSLFWNARFFKQQGNSATQNRTKTMFNALIGGNHIKSIKNDLLHYNRDRKLCTSTQLTEALAFGFGFNTHAAMLVRFKSDQPAACVTLDDARLWARLSALSELPIEALQDAIEIDLSESVSRAVGIRDMRSRLTLPAELEKKLDRFFKLMADYGAAYFTIDGLRLPSNAVIPFGGYRPGKHAMRQCFVPPQTRTHWEWDAASFNNLLADDFLVDHAGPQVDLTGWALEVIQLLERDVKMGNVVFHAETGLTVHHDEIEGCTKSVVYQRPGQLDDVRASDAKAVLLDVMRV